MDDNCEEWVESMGVVSRCGYSGVLRTGSSTESKESTCISVVYVIIVSVIIVSIVVIGCIIILRLYCMVCILQWNWCVSTVYACSVPSLTRSNWFVTVGLYKP